MEISKIYKMKYGFKKKWTNWKFYLGVILLQLFLGIILDWIFIKVGWGGYTWKEFFGWWFLRVGLVLLSNLFIDKFLRTNWFKHDLTNRGEVRMWILKHNKQLWEKIGEITEVFEKGEFRERYWWYREGFVGYLKTHKLKPWEKDYANWHLEIWDKIYKNER